MPAPITFPKPDELAKCALPAPCWPEVVPVAHQRTLHSFAQKGVPHLVGYHPVPGFFLLGQLSDRVVILTWGGIGAQVAN